MEQSSQGEAPGDDVSSSDTAQAGAGPACSTCGAALEDQFFHVNAQQSVCPNCAAQIGALQESNRFAFGPWLLGAVVGLVAAIVCGIVWALIVKATDYELGLAAIGVGLIVSWTVMRAAGGRRGPSIQFLTITLSIIGIFVGKGLTPSWALWDKVKPQLDLAPGDPEWIARIFVFLVAPVLMFSFFDILWYGFAIWEAWKLPRAIRVQLDGPYSMQASEDAESLQFDRAQPAAGSMPPNPPT